MKERAKSTKETPGQIFAEVVSELLNEVLMQLPVEDTCKRTIRNQRKKPPSPKTLVDLGEIPTEFTKLHNGDQFITYDNGANNPKRIIVFSTEENLHLFAKSKIIYIDGTFSVAPGIVKLA